MAQTFYLPQNSYYTLYSWWSKVIFDFASELRKSKFAKVCHKHELSTSQFHRPKQGKKRLFTESESLRFLSYLVEIILASLLKYCLWTVSWWVAKCSVSLPLHAVSFFSKQRIRREMVLEENDCFECEKTQNILRIRICNDKILVVNHSSWRFMSAFFPGGSRCWCAT